MTLRTSALALCYSTAEYCSPVWSHSAYSKLVDNQLNMAMHTIAGVLRPTQRPWLPVLSNIAPPHLRRKEATVKLLKTIKSNTALPFYTDLLLHPLARLPSRCAIWMDETPEDDSKLSVEGRMGEYRCEKSIARH